MSLAKHVRRELEREGVVVPEDGPTYRKVLSAARYAANREVDPRTAARWAVARVTQHVALEERAKLV